MQVFFDSLAIGQTFRIGDETFRKVSPLLSENTQTGQLLYDARLYPQWANAEPPSVQWPA